MTTNLAAIPQLCGSLELYGPDREAAQAVASGLRDSKAGSTRRASTSAWRRFQAWADAEGCPTFPTSPNRRPYTWATWRRPAGPWPALSRPLPRSPTSTRQRYALGS